MIKRNSIIILTVVASVLTGLALLSQPVFAAECGGATTSVISCSGNGEDAIISILKMVIRILTGGIGVLAVCAVVFGAILYGSSGSNPENMKKAKTIWTNTVIGLIVYAFFVAITNFLIPGGVFG